MVEPLPSWTARAPGREEGSDPARVTLHHGFPSLAGRRRLRPAERPVRVVEVRVRKTLPRMSLRALAVGETEKTTPTRREDAAAVLVSAPPAAETVVGHGSTLPPRSQREEAEC